MSFLMTGFECGGEIVLTIIKYAFMLMDYIFIIIPIILIVMCSYDFFKSVMAADDKDMKKSTNLIIKRIIAAVIMFFIPRIISFLVMFLGNFGINYKDCIEIARNEDLSQYKRVYQENTNSVKVKLWR